VYMVAEGMGVQYRVAEGMGEGKGVQGYRRHQRVMVMARVCLSHTGGQGCDRVAKAWVGPQRCISGMKTRVAGGRGYGRDAVTG
jgi:hypothetical protein